MRISLSSAEEACGSFQLKLGEQNVPLKRPCLVSGTDQAWVVTSQEPNTLQTMRFGFTSHGSETRIDQLNIPTDSLHEEDESDYNLFVFL